jgi:nucleotide-binding universal stress UspA family protein
MYKTVLAPLDGSELAEAALEHAIALAERFGARLVLVEAIAPLSERLPGPAAVLGSPARTMADVKLSEQALAADRGAAEAYLKSKKASLEARGLRVDSILKEADAAQAIITTAAAERADLIVMSTHGRGGLGRVVFGSVADEVLRNSPAPVLIVRPEAK